MLLNIPLMLAVSNIYNISLQLKKETWQLLTSAGGRLVRILFGLQGEMRIPEDVGN